MKGEFLIAEMLSVPWALRRDVLAAHTRVVAAWLSRGTNPMPQAMDDRAADGERISAFAARSRDLNARVGGGGIAVVPVYGTITQRAGIMTEWCGGTSTEQVSAALADAMRDDTVGQILMVVDSPGGSVYGVAELADEIVQAKKSKPVIGVANSLAASAGYWLLSACSECYVTPGGEVGSIGVWMAHEDWSKAYEEFGVKTTLISAGKYKTEGNPYEPLDDDALAFLQSRVDDYYNAFVKGVARGRGVSVDAVRSGMGQGRVLGADAALAEKMVDGVSTMSDVVKKMQRDAKSSRSTSSSSLAARRRELDHLEQ